MSTSDTSFYLKKIQRLSQALLISGALNIITLVVFAYWVARERPPTPYFELKPATFDQQQIPLADQRGLVEVINQLQPLSFNQLVTKLSSAQLIENGYSERDMALSSLIGFHNFDLSRALPVMPKQQRLFKWKEGSKEKNLTIYPGLSDHQFESIIAFAQTERWPITAEGMFALLQQQKSQMDPSLAEAFLLMPEFWMIDLLFNRTGASVSQQKILDVMLQGNWSYLKQFVDQQRQLNDLSLARRQKFLLDYIKQESSAAAYLLLEIDGDFAAKKLDDAQVIAILKLLKKKLETSEQFALVLLTSPRSAHVWKQASLCLYEYAQEPFPPNWSYQAALQRFAPHKIQVPENAIAQLVDKSQEGEKASFKKVPDAPAPIKNPKQPLLSITAAKAENEKKPKVIAKNEADKKLAGKPFSSSSSLYVVQEGDTLWKISKRFNIKVDVLKQFNALKSDSIKPGVVLRIP
jgi:LysM repeat protein